MKVKALTFDLFGTVFDWKTSIVNVCRNCFYGEKVDWVKFADSWKDKYIVSKDFKKLSNILQDGFYETFEEFGLKLDNHLLDRHDLAVISNTWAFLYPFRDCRDGWNVLENLDVSINTLSNADINMTKTLTTYSFLKWDNLISAEEVKCYKPDPRIYEHALKKLDLPAENVMMVASHTFDLNAAHKLGFRTALISRKEEQGSDPSGLDHECDIIEDDIYKFALKLKEKNGL